MPTGDLPVSHPRSDLFVSVVTTIRNAESYVERFVRDVSAVLQASFNDFEIVVVDDRSSDGTLETIERLQSELDNIQMYSLARHVGKDSALVVGTERAIGDVIITMEAESDPPEAIPKLLALYQQGHEIVYGVRSASAQGERVRDLLSRAYFTVFRVVTREFIPPDVTRMRLFSRRVANTFADNRDRYELFHVLAAFTGVAFATLEYQPSLRRSVRRESFLESLGRATLILLLSSKRPLRWITFGSLAGATLSFIYGVYVVLARLLAPDQLASGWSSLSLQIAGLFFVEFIVLAVMSEYLIRIFVHTQNRPPYLITRESNSLVLSRKEELNVSMTEVSSSSEGSQSTVR